MATKMPMRVALANATKPAPEEPGAYAEDDITEGLRLVGSKLLKVPGQAAEHLLGAGESLVSSEWEMPAERMPAPPPAPPTVSAAPPVPEPKKPPSKDVVSKAAEKAAELYREVGPQPPAPYARVKLPSGEWAEAGDPKIAGSFGKDKFASSRSGSSPESTLPADQQLDWMSFLDVRDRQRLAEDEERAGSEARTAASRASTARANVLAQEPFMAEDIAARSNLGKAAVEAQTEVSRRSFIENTIQKAEARINDLRNDPLAANPKYANWDPQRRRQHFEQLSPEERAKVAPSEADRRAAEEQIMQEVFLALGALTRTNLSPRASNPLEGLLNATAAGAEPKKE